MNNILNYIIETIFMLPAIVIGLSVHEMCHGAAAYALGDPTAKAAGRLTLNPIRHFDPIGFVMLVVAGFGWARPVPVNPNNFKKKRLGMFLVSLAGPASNIVVAFIVVNLYCVWLFFQNNVPSGIADNVTTIFIYMIYINIGLAIFNLIPVPPLDGSKMLFSLLPENVYFKIARFEPYGMLILVLLLIDPGKIFHFSELLVFLRDHTLDFLLKITSLYFPFQFL